MANIVDDVAGFFSASTNAVNSVASLTNDATKREIKAEFQDVKEAAITYASVQLAMMAIQTACAVAAVYMTYQSMNKPHRRKGK